MASAAGAGVWGVPPSPGGTGPKVTNLYRLVLDHHIFTPWRYTNCIGTGSFLRLIVARVVFYASLGYCCILP